MFLLAVSSNERKKYEKNCENHYQHYCKCNDDDKYGRFYSATIEPPAMGIPTEHYEISAQVIQNIPITVMKEYDQYTAVFTIERTRFMIYAEHLDYDECQKVLDSFLSEI